jgi:hypothetical protein
VITPIVTPRTISHQAFTDRKLHAPDRLAVEADRGAQGELGEIRADQIDRASVRIQTLRDQIDDIGQRFVEVVRTGDDLGDVGQKCDAVRNRIPPRRGRGFRRR